MSPFWLWPEGAFCMDLSKGIGFLFYRIYFAIFPCNNM